MSIDFEVLRFGKIPFLRSRYSGTEMRDVLSSEINGEFKQVTIGNMHLGPDVGLRLKHMMSYWTMIDIRVLLHRCIWEQYAD